MNSKMSFVTIIRLQGARANIFIKNRDMLPLHKLEPIDKTGRNNQKDDL